MFVVRILQVKTLEISQRLDLQVDCILPKSVAVDLVELCCLFGVSWDLYSSIFNLQLWVVFLLFLLVALLESARLIEYTSSLSSIWKSYNLGISEPLD